MNKDSELNFYVTGCSKCIKHGCVTPFNCMNAIQQKTGAGKNNITRLNAM